MTEKVDFDKYVGNYNSLLREGTSFFTADEEYFARYKIRILAKQTGIKPKRILEYGCGIGRNIPYLREAFPAAEIEGSDISEVSLEIARKLNANIRFFAEQSAGELTEKFDLIFVAGVFHHIPIPLRATVMSRIFDRLAPGGELLVFEHNPYNPVTRRIVDSCPYDADAVLLRPAELRNLISDAGFVEPSSGYCLFVPPKLSVLHWMESALSWLPLGGQYWVHGLRPA
jgi:SAM-dependent methyltransferase